MQPHGYLPLPTDTLITAAILGRVAAATPHTCLFPAIPGCSVNRKPGLGGGCQFFLKLSFTGVLTTFGKHDFIQ
jgi:hypothetical protein